MTNTDVVVVSYNSRNHLRDSVSHLTKLEGVSVIVVDNASIDGSLETIADLTVAVIRRSDNAGFAAGCNQGWRAGRAPHVLFLNPDASIDERSLGRLVASLDADPSLGAVAPRIEHPDGSIAWSQRRFPRLRSTFAQAFFLHRLFPTMQWSDELIRDPASYERVGSPEWVSGACLLVRRSALEEVGGWDEGFFLYCEDIDLCLRLRRAGHGIAFEPRARVVHSEGASAPRAATLPLLAASRVRYATKHRSRFYAALERVGIALGSLTHVAISRGGIADRAAHARALIVALSPRTGT
ncbi:MAG: glycosyltransferase family 2 protein [Actinobacteria bacterium]|nr:glycosyltransferase family 2 protein [Actinomycetota bacterium]